MIGVAADRTPDLRVTTVAAGLSHVWDLGFLPDGRVLTTERDGRISLLSGTSEGATVSQVNADLADVYVRGEGGLMGLVVHPDFAQTRRFTTCQTHMEAGTPTDVRLVTWQLSADGSARHASRTRWSAGCRSTRRGATPAAARRWPPTARCSSHR
ncbi:hypothetical protein BJF78_36025 [Pseudonocardia sp. CNS-139]|nr:hypothetical protein BJF78_36025 [Pseudonocardia sp. CNS-139]